MTWQDITRRIAALLGRPRAPVEPTLGPYERQLRAFATSQGLDVHVVQGAHDFHATFYGGIRAVEGHKALPGNIAGTSRTREGACQSLVEQLRERQRVAVTRPNPRIIDTLTL